MISHCGAGILLESLRANKSTNKEVTTKCIAVVNETLMHNHQSEIADALSADNYIVKAEVGNVLEKVDEVLSGKTTLMVYPGQKEGAIVDLINEMLQ